MCISRTVHLRECLLAELTAVNSTRENNKINMKEDLSTKRKFRGDLSTMISLLQFVKSNKHRFEVSLYSHIWHRIFTRDPCPFVPIHLWSLGHLKFSVYHNHYLVFDFHIFLNPQGKKIPNRKESLSYYAWMKEEVFLRQETSNQFTSHNNKLTYSQFKSFNYLKTQIKIKQDDVCLNDCQ